MALKMATREDTCEYVCPEARPLVTNQLEELRGGGATERDFTTTSLIVDSTQRLDRNIRIVNTFEHNEHKPQYKVVLDGQNEQKEMDNVPHEEKEMINAPAEFSSVPTEGYAYEEMHCTAQDSDDIDGDLSILSRHQPFSLNCQPDSYPNEEVNEVVTPIDGEDNVVNITSVEEDPQEVNDIQVVTMMPVECEDKSVQCVVVLPSTKTVQDVIEFENPKQKQQNVAKVQYRSSNWHAEFPLGETVIVKHDEMEYHQTHTIDGCLRTLVYKRVEPIDHQVTVFKKWEQLDNVHCDYVVAYLEDGIYGYIIKELLENEMVKVVRKIDNLLKTTEEDIGKLDMRKHPTAMEISRWDGRRKEEQRLRQLLRNLVMGVNNAYECLHQLGFVSLNLEAGNMYVKFTCNCWASQGCIHGSSGLTVVIINCESAYPVNSLVDSTTSSKAIKLVDPMHKYKRAEEFYDNLDIVVFVVKLLTEMSGDQSCKKELNLWMSYIAKAHFTDPPPVEAVQQIFGEYGMAQNDTIKMIKHLKVAAVHYARLHREHEV